VNTLQFRNGGANREFHPQGITSPTGDKIHPWGTASPFGFKFDPRGEVKNGPQVFRYMCMYVASYLGQFQRTGVNPTTSEFTITYNTSVVVPRLELFLKYIEEN
jgi:hypothetical protein